MTIAHPIGIVGGTGQLGGAIARGLLDNRFMAPEQLWISSWSGNTSTFEEGLSVRFTTRSQELVDACQTVILSVPPHLVPTLDLDTEGRHS